MSSDLAPEGFIVILDTLARRMPQRALLVVEEPEIHKNPLMVGIRGAAGHVEEKDVTAVMATHSDLVALTLAKPAQAKGRGCDYFTREPWARAEEVKIFPDGAVEELWEEAAAALF